jgi:bacillithiol biosynthesis cysteine-adding enzyme BshC
LAGEAAARAFIASDFRSADERKAAARRAAARAVAPGLLTALREQDGRLPPSEARRRNLDALASGGAAVVATGQQVGLFLGPLYSFYKAASAVAVARTIQAESGVRCVPLFWLQTEDHDFVEIAAATIAGTDGATATLSLRLDEGGENSPDERCSIAHRVLGAEVSGLVDALAEALPPGPAATEMLALLRAHYLAGRAPAAAFAGVLATLFADEGLLILDPRDARVAADAIPIYRRAVATAPAVEHCLNARRAHLHDAGFDEQITLRADCALLFFHPRGVTGPRFRLQAEGEGRTPTSAAPMRWALAGDAATVAHVALLETLQQEPLRFSTSALLRPIVQDTLLPTVAYVGGPGEINYFAQLGPLYEHFGLTPPLIVPRGRFRFIDARTRRLLRELGLSADDAARSRVELGDRLPPPRQAGAPDPAELRRIADQQLTPALEAIVAPTLASEPELARAAERTRASVATAVRRFVDRYQRRLMECDTTTTDRLERLRAALCPNGVPQERVYSWPSLAGRLGWRTLKQLVMENLETAGPFATTLRDIEP